MKHLLSFFALFGSVAYAANVVDVKVDAADGFGGDTSAVLARCQTKPGSTYDPVTVVRDVNSLKASGDYQDIKADAEWTDGGDVVVTFRVFRKVRFQGPLTVKGADMIGESKIADETGLKEGRLYGEAEFTAAAEKVKDLYRRRHHPDAKVTPVTTLLPGGNDCTLELLVEEGPELDIGDWVFEGAAEDLSWWRSLGWFGGRDKDESVRAASLREHIGVYPWWNPTGWFTKEPASEVELAQAAEKVATRHAEAGYLDAKVTGPVRRAREDGKTDLVYTVDKGMLYKIGNVSIEGVTRYPADLVAERSSLPKTGDIAGLKVLEDAAQRISETVGSGDSGLADSHTTYRWMAREDDPSVVDIVFVVKEGVPVVINQIRIEGNDYTKDKVIRREIELSPGNRMLADRAERSKRHLENLDYFSRVRYHLKETGKGKDDTGAEYRDLVYEVEEKNTGNFMIGVAAGSVDSIYAYVELKQSNFDLFAPERLFRGGGQKGRVSVQVGPRIQTYEASITEPHLFDRLLELTVEGYRRQRWYDEYDLIRSGLAASLAYPVKFWNPARLWNAEAADYVQFGNFGVRLSGEYIEFDDIEHGDWMYRGRVVSLDEEERRYGDAFEGVARLFWSRDTRDRPRMASSGSRTHLFLDLAGGDNEYWRLGFNHRSYFTTWKDYNHVLMLAFRAETIDAFTDDVPIYNRMFLGGPRSIRGVQYRHVSPFARRYKDEELRNSYMPWGGQTLICANVEYTIPIVKMLRLAAFSDIGAVGEDEFDLDLSDNFAWSVGLGLRIDIPMFPIRLDFATPIEKPDNADKEVFSFTVGYDF